MSSPFPKNGKGLFREIASLYSYGPNANADVTTIITLPPGVHRQVGDVSIGMIEIIRCPIKAFVGRSNRFIIDIAVAGQEH